jgi:hypothetical protein
MIVRFTGCSAVRAQALSKQRLLAVLLVLRTECRPRTCSSCRIRSDRDLRSGCEGLCQEPRGQPREGVGLWKCRPEVKGKIFAMLVKGRFVAKLPKLRVDELVSVGDDTRYDPPARRQADEGVGRCRTRKGGLSKTCEGGPRIRQGRHGVTRPQVSWRRQSLRTGPYQCPPPLGRLKSGFQRGPALCDDEGVPGGRLHL